MGEAEFARGLDLDQQYRRSLKLAERLWELRTGACGGSARSARDPLGLVLAKLAQ